MNLIPPDFVLGEKFRQYYELTNQQFVELKELLSTTFREQAQLEAERFETKEINGVPLVYIPADPDADEPQKRFLASLREIIHQEKAEHFMAESRNSFAIHDGNFGKMARLIKVLPGTNPADPSEASWDAQVLAVPLTPATKLDELEDFGYMKDTHASSVFRVFTFRVVPDMLRHLIDNSARTQ